MRTGTLHRAWRHICVVTVAAAVCTWGVAVFAPSLTESAVANGDTRTLHLYHTHTFETIDATFRVNGEYDPAVLRQLNHFLRDWRNNDEHEMDPRLFDAVWEAYRSAGATDRIQIYSAYRSPETNAMLRRRSRAVAEHSQHMLGKAMDTTMPGFPMERIRDAGMKLQHGGVGWYPSANFVHLDVGGVRSWPRMPYDELVSLFPDGKTVHIAADGRTLPGYDAARMEIAERGGTDIPPAQESQGFLAWLFGSGSATAHEDEEDRRAPATPAPVAVASAAPQEPTSQTQQSDARPSQVQSAALAYADGNGQPLDGHVQVASADQQVAALEPSDVDTSVMPDVAMPLPPRRPADLADAEALDVPMPPIRPDSLVPIQSAPRRQPDMQTASLSSDAIGGLITSTASGVPMVRKSRLPSIITHGTAAGMPGNALGFAAVDAADLNPVIPKPIARPAGLGPTGSGKVMGLRAGARAHARTAMAIIPPGIVAEDNDETAVVAGPKLIGLRKAARLAEEKAAL